jgi:MerR family transcriptional regulator, Zn(II)-responsive regulator of zntA
VRSHMADKGLLIGELAAELGLNPKTIRYYEEIGLLPEPERSESGYRLYTRDDLERLRFIGKAKAIGLSLEQIAEVLALRGAGRQPCEHVLALLDEKLAAVDRQLRALRDFKRDLTALRDEAARTAASGPAEGDACVCGIIERAATSAEPPPLSLSTARH